MKFFSKLIKTEYAVFFSIFLIGFIVRFYKFDVIPFGLNHDGAQDALQSIDILQHPWPFRAYMAGGSGETLFKYYLAIIIGIFGPTVWAIKFGSTLLSLLTIPFFYLFARRLAGRQTALFSTFFFSVSGWHIIMGKTVWRAITMPLFECITLYFLVRIIQKNKFLDYFLCGIFLTLTLNTYNAARAFPIFILGILFLFGIKRLKTDLKKTTLGILLFLTTFSITLSPLLFYAFNNWDEFNSRLNSLSLLSTIQKTGNLSPLLENLKTSTLIFTVRANGDDFFISQPLLDQPVSFLFLIGIVYCLATIKKTSSFFSLLGLPVNIIPGFISVPNGNRDIGVMPFVYLISGLGLYGIWRLLNKLFNRIPGAFLPKACVIGIFLWSFFITYNLYFSSHRPELWGFYPETTIVGNYMKPRLPFYSFYLTDNYPSDALTFLTYQGGDPYKKHYTWFYDKNQFLTVKQGNKGIIFVMFDTPENKLFMNKLESKFPEGTVSLLPYNNDNINRNAALLYIFERKI